MPYGKLRQGRIVLRKIPEVLFARELFAEPPRQEADAEVALLVARGRGPRPTGMPACQAAFASVRFVRTIQIKSGVDNSAPDCPERQWIRRAVRAQRAITIGPFGENRQQSTVSTSPTQS